MSNVELAKETSREQSVAQRVETARRVTPRVDIFENDREYLLLADVPGVSAETLRVQFEPPELVIEGDRKVDEGPPVRYTRAFRLDERIDPEGITAELKHGVLRLKLAKSKASQARRIQVKPAA
jgi:HSP20 family molecular chaperone IbpA